MNALIIGRRRQGKSTLAYRLATLEHRSVIVFDPNAQFHGQVIRPDAIGAWLEQPGQRGVVVVRPQAGRIEDDFSALAGALRGYGNYALLLDEASTLQRAQALHSDLEWYIRQAPREGPNRITVIQTMHRVVDAHPICRALVTDVFLFQTSLARDLDAVEAQWGPEIRDILPTLARWHCIHQWGDLDGREKFQVWRRPSDWYVRLDTADRSGTNAGA